MKEESSAGHGAAAIGADVGRQEYKEDVRGGGSDRSAAFFSLSTSLFNTHALAESSRRIASAGLSSAINVGRGDAVRHGFCGEGEASSVPTPVRTIVVHRRGCAAREASSSV